MTEFGLWPYSENASMLRGPSSAQQSVLMAPQANFNSKSEANMRRAFMLLLLGLLLPASFLAAQEFTGRVSDPTGAILWIPQQFQQGLGTIPFPTLSRETIRYPLKPVALKQGFTQASSCKWVKRRP